MELKDYYAIMGVKPTDDTKTIKTAYRRLAKKYHPDVSKEPNAEERFKEIAQAWEILGDEQRRAEYDELWAHRNDPKFKQFTQQHSNTNQETFSQEDFDDIYASFFGQRSPFEERRAHQSFKQRGHDLEIELAIFLEESQEEHKRTISYHLPVYNVFGIVEKEIPKTLNIKIPAGVIDGQRIRLKGQGTRGENGGENGDLWLTIRIAPHPLFDIKGHDLEIVVPVAPWGSGIRYKNSYTYNKRENIVNYSSGKSSRAKITY
ncbi:curved DNA-binding protein CbpA [Proteus vulgaris]|nr:curved DNA-binding protein CbpA [Proteus vulgaris]